MIDALYFKLAGAAGILALVAYGTWYTTSDHYQKKIDEIQLQMASAVQEQLIEDAAKIEAGDTQHGKDQLTINNLRNDAGRVQVHIPSCSPAEQTGKDTDGRARVLSEGVDRLFADLQRRFEELAARADQLNIDAIRSNNSQ